MVNALNRIRIARGWPLLLPCVAMTFGTGCAARVYSGSAPAGASRPRRRRCHRVRRHGSPEHRSVSALCVRRRRCVLRRGPLVSSGAARLGLLPARTTAARAPTSVRGGASARSGRPARAAQCRARASCPPRAPARATSARSRRPARALRGGARARCPPRAPARGSASCRFAPASG